MIDRRPVATYLMLNERNLYIKIGSSRNPVIREKTLQSEEPEITLIAVSFEGGGVLLERELHRRYAEKRLRGEWFNLSAEDVEQLIFTAGFDVPVFARRRMARYFADGLKDLKYIRDIVYEIGLGHALTEEFIAELGGGNY